MTVIVIDELSVMCFQRVRQSLFVHYGLKEGVATPKHVLKTLPEHIQHEIRGLNSSSINAQIMTITVYERSASTVVMRLLGGSLSSTVVCQTCFTVCALSRINSQAMS